MDQFVADAPWSRSAGYIDVYKLYGEWVGAHATDDQLRQAVQDIGRRGMVLAVEAGPLDPPADCGHGVESFAGIAEGRNLAARIERAGGRIAVMALDEPYYFAHLYDGPNACHWPVEKIAEAVAGYVREMRTFFPELIVGDIEPTPVPVSAAGLADWLDAYQAAAGEPFGFLHLDIDWGRQDWVAMAHDMQDRAQSRGVPLGMIYNGGAAPLREQWIQLAGERIKAFEAAGPVADHAIFQSWMVQPDHALPETDPTAFSGLVLRYVEDYDALGIPTTGPGANLALRRPTRASGLLSGSSASGAVDGDFDTLWNSGGGPVQWIEIRLDGAQDVGSIRLTVAQSPEGETDHRVLGRKGGDLVELHRFTGFTSEGMTLEFTPTEPLHDVTAIRVETRLSPSWVAWREIEVHAP